MRLAHRMPFGATVEDGGARFRLWAPGAREVALVIAAEGDDGRPMQSTADGWFETRTSGVPVGARYAFRIDGGQTVPDPASRANPDGVHEASALVDPTTFQWRHPAQRTTPWEEAVVYELHVGTFTAAGTFAAAAEQFARLKELGVTAVELMPVAGFPGQRNWGYDGVLLYAPAASYGTPDDLKRLVDHAHSLGLMVLLDVVYNHFGPEGNYLHLYAPRFFNPRHQTPWGAAINFDGEHSRTVRDFFIHNAIYWIEEYQFDGLRLDAVHAIADDSTPDIVTELTQAVRDHVGAQRHVHLVLENDRNESRRLVRNAQNRPVQGTAQWNDDIHHALHVLLTGERDGYYADYAAKPLEQLGRCLAEGFAFQGEPSALRDGERRGEPSAALPPTAFVTFTQTHDQVGNRAFGERLAALASPPALRAAVACVLLAPAPPMLFMGEEYGARTPFLYFCDFGPELAEAVSKGRRAEFGQFDRFRDQKNLATIPDASDPATFASSKLDPAEARSPAGIAWLAHYRELLALRREHVVPHLAGLRRGGTWTITDNGLLRVRWPRSEGGALHLTANFSDATLSAVERPPGTPFYESDPGACASGTWPPYTVAATREDLA